MSGFSTSIVGAACKGCGHTNLLHSTISSRVPNDECQVCRLEMLIHQFTGMLSRANELIGKMEEAASEPAHPHPGADCGCKECRAGRDPEERIDLPDYRNG